MALSQLARGLVILVACLIGAAVGSAIAGYVARAPEDRADWLHGRSRCPRCGTVLGWAELVPLLSWLVQRGRCRQCSGEIARSYPLTEVVAVSIAALAFWVQPIPVACLTSLLGWWLLALAAMDLREYRLPDLLTLPLAAIGTFLALLALEPLPTVGASLIGGVVAGGTLLAVRWSYARLRRREGLGLGDVKLAAAIGTWLGPWPLPTVLLLAGGLGILHALAAGAGRDPSIRIPFGPSLAGAFWLVWLAHP